MGWALYVFTRGIPLGTHSQQRSSSNNEKQTLGELRMSGIANEWWAGLLVFTRGIPLVARSKSDTG